jgi:hypothetical protein
MPRKSRIDAPGAVHRISMTSLSARLNISVNSISQSVARGKMLAKKHGYSLI